MVVTSIAWRWPVWSEISSYHKHPLLASSIISVRLYTADSTAPRTNLPSASTVNLERFASKGVNARTPNLPLLTELYGPHGKYCNPNPQFPLELSVQQNKNRKKQLKST